jgi:hypothetical protein
VQLCHVLKLEWFSKWLPSKFRGHLSICSKSCYNAKYLIREKHNDEFEKKYPVTYMFYNFREFNDYYILFIIWMFFQILGKKSFVFGCQYLEVLSIIARTLVKCAHAWLWQAFERTQLAVFSTISVVVFFKKIF